MKLIFSPLAISKEYQGQALYAVRLVESITNLDPVAYVYEFKHMKKKCTHSLVQYFNLYEAIKLVKLIKRKNISKVHFIYAPACFLYLFMVVFLFCISNNRPKIWVTFPDYFGSYYFQLFRRSYKIKYLINALVFTFCEKVTRKIATIHVNGSSVKNDYATPLICKKGKVLLSKTSNKILLVHPSRDFFAALITYGVFEKYDLNWEVIVSDDQIISQLKPYSNISFKYFVDNFEEFVAGFKLSLLYDYQGAGMSTKVATLIGSGCLPLGNEICFRGMKDVPIELLYNIEDLKSGAVVSQIKKLLSTDIDTELLFKNNYYSDHREIDW